MTATLIGATGLIGNYLLEELLNDPFYDTVRNLIRRPLNKTHPKLEKKIVEFNDGDSLLVALSNSDVIFCTIGTTMKKVKGDKVAYRKIDYDIPANTSRFCKMVSCEKFILVSSAGANKKSINFYTRLKGEAEDAVKEAGLKTVHIMRPSMLLGKRKETRAGESIGKFIMTNLSFLIPKKYKAIHGKDVAKAMLVLSKRNKEGFFIHENAEIKELSL
jgi:uncharacterized protein YbjT (DUF2867 family)